MDLIETEIKDLASFLSPSNFKRILKKDNLIDHLRRFGKYLKTYENTTYNELITEIYKVQLSHYRNEYVYKNILFNKLFDQKSKFEESHALNEFRIGHSIADFVFLNGEANVYEIKTEFDNLNRLTKQFSDYYKFADRIYVVSCSGHIPKLLDRYQNSDVGILELTQRNTLEAIKKPIKNSKLFCHSTLFNTLRKNEYLDLVNNYFGYTPNEPNTKIFRKCYELTKDIEVKLFQKLVIKQLKSRAIYPSFSTEKEDILEPLLYICYCLNLNKVQYQKLNSFLEDKCTSHI